MTITTLYETSAQATGGRDGRVATLDGSLGLKLTTPKELGGPGGDGNNPEQLFAAGYAACFLNALKFTAMRAKATLSGDAAVVCTVGIGRRDGGGFALKVAHPDRDDGARVRRVNSRERRPPCVSILGAQAPTAASGVAPHGIDSGDIAEGTLVLDLFDRASGEEVWHGQVTGRVLPGIVDSDRLNNAVRSLVSEVPQAIAAPAPSVELAPDGV